jgi:hypothetical protein
VQDLLLRGADMHQLATAGVGWVVVEGSAPPLSLPIAYRDKDIALYRVGGVTPAASGRALLIAAHLVWLGMLVGALAAMVVQRRGFNTPRRRVPPPSAS